MVTKQLVKERELLAAFLGKVHAVGEEAVAYWGTIHPEDYKDFCSLKVVLVGSSKVTYKGLKDFCVRKGIKGFKECKDGKGIIKVYLK